MEPITRSQYNALLNRQIPQDLDPHIIADIRYIKNILLTQEGNNYYLEYVELDMLSAQEIVEMKRRGTFVTI